MLHKADSSSTELNNNLAKITHWAQQWKMNFDLDSSKQAQDLIFNRKFNKGSHPALTFNNNTVNQTAS